MAGRSELFGTQHRHHEVGEASKRDEADDDVFHGEIRFEIRASAHLVAKAHVGCARGEEPDGEGDEHEIVHAASIRRNRRAA